MSDPQNLPIVETVALAEEAVERASEAAGDERWEEALAWTRRARVLAPTSRMLLMDEAFFCEETGRLRQALALYDEAAAASHDDGEPHFHAANLLLRLGASRIEAAHRMRRCLERSPEFVLDLVDPMADGYRALLCEPSLQAAMRRAARALGLNRPLAPSRRFKAGPGVGAAWTRRACGRSSSASWRGSSSTARASSRSGSCRTRRGCTGDWG